ncbi:MAG: glutamyl-tRNA reductase [Candidatus Binatia bacterium]|nr:MAG: glutamyl-tRNA reductase [Candidatus Binatia bacterium]
MKTRILLVGLSHHTAPVEVREALAVPTEESEEAYRELLALPGVDEAVVLSTCNRVEVVCGTRNPELALDSIRTFLRSRDRTGRTDFESALYAYRDAEAVRHLFRVAASLDSMVVGEPQILGQVKESYTRASAAGATGTVLHRCFHKAFSVAKRVRAETGIGSRAVSVSSAAVELARKIFDRLENKCVMLIGAGRMSELAARHLLGQGIGELIVTNRTFDRAVALAREFGGTPVPFEHFPRYLHMADVVLGSTGSQEFVLTRPLVQEAMRQRQRAPMFLIDLGVPRNFDPRINEIENVYLYDIDDLEGVVEVNREERLRESAKAEELVTREVESFERWLESLEAVPTIVALRERCERIRQEELARTLASLGPLGEKEKQALDAMTSAIVKKILHGPLSKLKEPADDRTEKYYIAAARDLFRLDDEGEEEIRPAPRLRRISGRKGD